MGEGSSTGTRPAVSAVVTDPYFDKDVNTPPTAHVYQEHDDFQLTVKKVELPNFNGTDPVGWVYRAEQYFEVHNTRPEHKVRLAFIAIEEVVVHWLRWLQGKSLAITWEGLVAELIRRFGGSNSGNPYEKMAGLRQQSSVEDYIQQFE